MRKGGYYYIEFKNHHFNGKYEVINKTNRGIIFFRNLKDDSYTTTTEQEIKRFIELYYF